MTISMNRSWLTASWVACIFLLAGSIHVFAADEPDGHQLAKQAAAHYTEGRHAQAVQLARQAALKSPDDAALQLLLANYALSAGDGWTGTAALDQFLKLRPQRAKDDLILKLKKELKAISLKLMIYKDGWGEASTFDVFIVLQAAAREFRPHFKDHSLPAINVTSDGGPLVHYQRGDDGRIYMRLNVNGRYWAQMTYQFSSRLAAIHARFDADPHGNDWFEESIFEAAALYVLRRSGEKWKVDPPDPVWKSYAKHFTEYADGRIKAAQLPKGQTLAKWFTKERESLHDSKVDFNKTAKIGTALLPLFEKSPQHWDAIWWLNAGTPKTTQTFEQFLGDWRKNAPKKHREFIDQIAKQFDVKPEK